MSKPSNEHWLSAERDRLDGAARVRWVHFGDGYGARITLPESLDADTAAEVERSVVRLSGAQADHICEISYATRRGVERAREHMRETMAAHGCAVEFGRFAHFRRAS